MINPESAVFKTEPQKPNEIEKLDVPGSMAFLSVHLACLLVFFAGFSWAALGLCIFSYVIRMFGITAGFHRYFSHRSYQTSRVFQFALGVLGTCAGQKGPLWWAAHHREHHRNSDGENDIHSPVRRGFWWAHAGWILCKKYVPTNFGHIQDFAKYPELRFLNRFDLMISVLYAVAIFGLGEFLGLFMEITGFQALIWGYFISTVFLYHGTFTINSLAHVWGTRRFQTSDFSRNNFFLAMITLGEGWHNNHHRFPYSEKQGLAWYEIDISHWILKTLSWLRVVRHLRRVPVATWKNT